MNSLPDIPITVSDRYFDGFGITPDGTDITVSPTSPGIFRAT